ncbi:MAG TPA: hypothetical protein VMF08_02160 [Candidatus Sulfotelmatobacter sp.]|nr:hypothetical protein [Candidatus Sulfotelmatobacter sp.]
MPPFKTLGWKNWIIAFLILAGLGIGIDAVFTRYIVLRGPNSPSGRIAHLLELNPNEIPVFGTSRVRSMDLGTNGFNYAQDAASFALTDVFLQIELAKKKTTPIVVEFQFSDSGTLGDEAYLIPFAGDPRIRSVLSQFHKMSWRYFVPGLRYFGYYDWMLQDYLNERRSFYRVTRGSIEYLRSPPFNQARFNQIVRQRLDADNGFLIDDSLTGRLIDEIKTHPQRLFILVATPVHRSCFHNFQNEDHLKSIEARLEAMPNVELIDWSRLPYPDTAFADTVHLRPAETADLSQKFRIKVSQILQQRNLPPLITPEVTPGVARAN